jgi:aspartate carbamoyltransferase catalytic subunit
MRHILSAKDFKKDEIAELFKIAGNISLTNSKLLKNIGKLVGTLFFEPSTRTRLSFEAAAIKLGGQVISVESAMGNSSAKKGESLKDTFKTVSQYVDLIVVRHPEDKAIEDAVEYSDVPVISAGSGVEEHPTQALLDLFTIKNNFGSDPQKLNIMFTGDLAYSRTIKSLLYLLQPYNMNIMINPMHGEPTLNWDDVSCYWDDDIYNQLPNIDILYMTRHQTERTKETRNKSRFRMTYQFAEAMKSSAIIMHPLPRNEEIDPSTDRNPRAVYFSQVKNGLWVRMALLSWLLNNN